MNPIAYISTQMQLRRKRKELKECEHMLWMARDQVASGKAMQFKQEERQRQLYAEIAMLEPPDQIIREAGAGA